MTTPDSLRSRQEDIPLHLVFAQARRWARRIVAMGVAGGILGAAFALTREKTYSSDAVFVPEQSESTSGLALAASQLGLGSIGSTGEWGPEAYIELLESRAVLKPVCAHEVNDPARPGQRVPVGVLLSGDSTCSSGVLSRIGSHIEAEPVPALSGVQATVTTPWPGVSHEVTQLLLDEINRLNIERRTSRAGTERAFLEEQTALAATRLRTAEDRLQGFLQANRSVVNAPALRFQQERLQDEVQLRSQLHASLLQNLEDARLREVRDVPVVSVVEPPVRPDVANARNVVLTTIMGGMAMGVVAVVLMLLALRRAATPRAPGGEYHAPAHSRPRATAL